MIDALLQDLRLAARQLSARPWFTAAAVATLGLGLGVTTAVFSLANWVMLRPVPGVRDPGHVVLAVLNGTQRPVSVSYPNFVDIRARTPAFSGLAAHSNGSQFAVRAGDAPAQFLQGEIVTRDFFQVLGTVPSPGRYFTHSEEQGEGAPLVAIVSHRVWMSRLRGDSGVAGRSITVNGTPVTVIGVAPKGFQGTDLLGRADIWFPVAALRRFSAP